MRKLFLLLSILISVIANATTYYVSTTGNDGTGKGTQAAPWKTLYKATITVNSIGDIIHVNTGTYTETQQSKLAAGVSIEGEGITTILKSNVTSANYAMIVLASPKEGSDGNQHISNVKMDGQALKSYWAIYVQGRSNVSIHDITVVDFNFNGVIFTGRIDNVTAAPNIYATGNTFYNNVLINNSGWISWGEGNFNFSGQDGMVISNNMITQTARPGSGNGYCTKFNNAGWNKGCKVLNNTFTRAQAQGGTYDIGMELGNTSGMEVSGNTFIGCSLDPNFNTKTQNGSTYNYSLWVHDNKFTIPVINSQLQDGVIFEFGTEGAIVENNIFDKLNFGVSFTPREGSVISDITIRNNLMTGIGRSVWNGYYITFGGVVNGSYTVNGVSIYNNTFDYDKSLVIPLGISLPQATAGNFSNINIYNNIITGATTAPIGQAGTTAITNLFVKNNDFFANFNDNKPIFIGPAVGAGYTLLGNINVAPVYGLNYSLPVGSPLLKAGVGGTDIGYTGGSVIIAPVDTIPKPVKALLYTIQYYSDGTFIKNP